MWQICEKAKFGRSLFERLVLLGHNKHLLNVQYRMHPSISRFPNMEFYGGKITDAAIVQESIYQKRFLQGNMYGSFSFINVGRGKEEFGDGHSPKNMIEVAVISEIISKLFKGIIYIYFYNLFFIILFILFTCFILKQSQLKGG